MNVNICPPFEEMDLQVVAKSKRRGESLDLLRDVLSYFVSSANAGAFSGPPYSPALASMQLVSSNDGPEEEIDDRWRCRHVTPAAFKILLGMITQSHYGHMPLDFF